MKKILLLLFLPVMLAACESNAKKLERLEAEKTTECLLQEAYWTKYQAAAYPHRATLQKVKSPAADSLGRVWNDHHVKCELAIREYNQFMR